MCASGVHRARCRGTLGCFEMLLQSSTTGETSWRSDPGVTGVCVWGRGDSHVALGLCSCLNAPSLSKQGFLPGTPRRSIWKALGGTHTHTHRLSSQSGFLTNDTCESLLHRCVLAYVLKVYTPEKPLWQWAGRVPC